MSWGGRLERPERGLRVTPGNETPDERRQKRCMSFGLKDHVMCSYLHIGLHWHLRAIYWCLHFGRDIGQIPRPQPRFDWNKTKNKGNTGIKKDFNAFFFLYREQWCRHLSILSHLSFSELLMYLRAAHAQWNSGTRPVMIQHKWRTSRTKRKKNVKRPLCSQRSPSTAV